MIWLLIALWVWTGWLAHKVVIWDVTRHEDLRRSEWGMSIFIGLFGPYGLVIALLVALLDSPFDDDPVVIPKRKDR